MLSHTKPLTNQIFLDSWPTNRFSVMLSWGVRRAMGGGWTPSLSPPQQQETLLRQPRAAERSWKVLKTRYIQPLVHTSTYTQTTTASNTQRTALTAIKLRLDASTVVIAERGHQCPVSGRQTCRINACSCDRMGQKGDKSSQTGVEWSRIQLAAAGESLDSLRCPSGCRCCK